MLIFNSRWADCMLFTKCGFRAGAEQNWFGIIACFLRRYWRSVVFSSNGLNSTNIRGSWAVQQAQKLNEAQLFLVLNLTDCLKTFIDNAVHWGHLTFPTPTDTVGRSPWSECECFEVLLLCRFEFSSRFGVSQGVKSAMRRCFCWSLTDVSFRRIKCSLPKRIY